eukprot:TRINITY_DN5752_c0_g2_i2.p1 TRINITY_DN5752_c0_g2~~TRINITY_DN5752_c0_g2_i2.p1  ORF type:complete len:147 (+),score=16.89 TRINITY_DN5752_c0_g2_i2:217-657(+)
MGDVKKGGDTYSEVVKEEGTRSPRGSAKAPRAQRTYRACEGCRLLKKKCDGGLPCLRCTQAGMAEDCTYTSPKKRGKKENKSQNTPYFQVFGLDLNKRNDSTNGTKTQQEHPPHHTSKVNYPYQLHHPHLTKLNIKTHINFILYKK